MLVTIKYFQYRNY